MSRSIANCPICGGCHSYRACPQPINNPYRPKREDESESVYHNRLRYRQYSKSWRAKNPETAAKRNARNLRVSYLRAQHPDSVGRVKNRRQFDARKKLIDSYKSKPCMDCTRSFPSECMQFDHRPGEIKKFNVSSMVRSHGVHAIEDEIKKCDLVCANCHAIRTASRSRERLKSRTPVVSVKK